MANKVIKLKGITWDHSRGYCPMVATAQRFSEIHPNVEIEWDKRSLQGFADEHIDQLALNYDLLVIDHPWAGYAADTKIILPLNDYLPESFLEDQKNNSVGRSYESYNFGGDQFALPIDAATPVASSRPDLMERMNLSLPKTFNELLHLASKGVVTMPGIPIDTLMNFYMFCGVSGETPFQSPDQVVNEDVGKRALDMLKELADRLNPEFFYWSPIQVCEAMTTRDDLAYCPWAYGYSNYSRKGYTSKLLHYHNLINDDKNEIYRSTLGGTGLAISTKSKYKEIASEYAMLVANPGSQSTLFFENGGQPGHKKAWEDENVNAQSANFFKSTLKTLDNAFLRPRYNGYMHFQDNAGDVIRDYLMNGGHPSDVLSSINKIYLESKGEK
ncbi:extracellular solute-binding protein [Tamlana sp. 2201CG12-4]|uniref:ABC transporter substrate-binding protein n=1 Tax=Tamlana sp. 2201CG12-4 TaxID=3112582 RepID=UPI002DBB0088|nr:extracellular solute-binding protein [Tamlana sp. 2201CG12-4]MEC3907856.1 extracellular solute-binding protein [Tamlana sp. 2201CG12-4]